MNRAITIFLSLTFISVLAFSQEITVKSPNGGEKWIIGNNQQITWEATGFDPGDKLKIVLVRQGQVLGTIKNNVDPASGSHPWEVGKYGSQTAISGKGYKIAIAKQGSGDTIRDASDKKFTIMFFKPGSGTPSPFKIDVTKPNTASNWDPGKMGTIRWETKLQKVFKIELYDYKKKTFKDLIGWRYVIGDQHFPEDGKYQYQWNIPKDYKWVGGKFSVRISADNGSYEGFSEKFSIRQISGSVHATIGASIWDRYTWKWQDENLSSYYGPVHPIKPETWGWAKIPGTCWAGYVNGFSGSHGDSWRYQGFIFRTCLTFDVSQFKGKIIEKATLILQHHKLVCNEPGPYRTYKLWVMNGQWVNNMDTPADFKGLMTGQNQITFVITDLVWDWANGVTQNLGLLITGNNENWDHNNQKCIGWYTPKLMVTYRKKI